MTKRLLSGVACQAHAFARALFGASMLGWKGSGPPLTDGWRVGVMLDRIINRQVRPVLRDFVAVVMRRPNIDHRIGCEASRHQQ